METKPIVIHGREAFYIKKKDLPYRVYEGLIRDYSFHFFEERVCNDCELKPHRDKDPNGLTPTCEECAAHLGSTIMARDEKVGKNTYLRTPIGNWLPLKKRLLKSGVEYKVKRHHPRTKMKRPIRFKGTYRAKYQEEAVEALVTKKRGVLRAPPRSGKTVMGSAAVCVIGEKTIIIASQREWLLGFQETFIGSDTQPALTTCKPNQIGICKTYADFLKYDVCLVTVQTFYNESGQKLLRKIRDLFSIAIVDEVHKSAAAEYAKCLSKLNVRYLWGLSGTPERKDGRDIIMRQLVGPDLYEAEVPQLQGEVRLTRTAFSANTKGNQMWARMVGSLEKNPERLKLIAKWAIKDAKNGHMILIPFAQVKPIQTLVKMINDLAGAEIARPFYGGLKKKDRDTYLQAARQYKIKVLVGNIGLLSTGTNIPRASALYEVTMSSNLPNAQQRFARILTPYDDKPTPLYRFFLDDTSVRRRCMSNEFWKCLMPKFKPKLAEADAQILKSYFAGQDKKDNMSDFKL